MKLKFVYPSSALKASRVDEFFEDEVSMLVDSPVLYSAFENRLVRGEFIEGATIVYRGWILTVSEYCKLNELVEAKGAVMLVSPESYEKSQFANGWLNSFSGLTPLTTVYPYNVLAETIVEDFGSSSFSYVVKGGSKSLKNDWANSMFAETGSDVVRVVNNFRSQVSESEEGFLLVREFENWLPGEFRIWWFSGSYVIDQHPNNDIVLNVSESLLSFLNVVEGAVNELGAEFVTTDIVRTVDGFYRVVEVGNGQVSGAYDFTKVICAIGDRER